MDIRFDNRLILVTGAGSGIGYTCAKMLAESGAAVIMVGKRPDKIEKAAEELRVFGKTIPFSLDISDREAVMEGVAEIKSRFGAPDGLVQCAGHGFKSMPGAERPLSSYENWDMSLALNAGGSFQMMKEVVEQCMLPQRRGAVVNIASMAGIRGMMPPLDNFGYSAGKAAVVSMTMQAAVVWSRKGVRVNAIAPGGVESAGVGVDARPIRDPNSGALPYIDLIPSGRHSKPEEIAAAALFLLSDYSGNTSGHTLIIDGGASVMGF